MLNNLFDYEKRQKDAFSKMDSASILIVDNNPVYNRTGDQDFGYRPNSYMVYLVGFEEPNSHLVLTKNKDGDCSSILFVQPRDPEKETWTGRIHGPENTKRLFKVSEAFDITEFPEWLTKNNENFTKLYYEFGNNTPLDSTILDLFKRGVRSKKPTGTGITVIENARTLLAPLRLIKDEKEIEIMQKACDISSEAHIKAMEFIKPSTKEFEIENVVNSHFRGSGANGPGYSSICATGDNATILHYISNNAECKDGELFLLDAACEYAYYSSDITRTFPVSGKFTELQKKIYNIVLKAETEAIKSCTVGNTYKKVHELVLEILTKGLIELGILEGELSKLLEDKAFMPYYMHGTGHWLGIDTHDVGGRFYLNENNEFTEKTFVPGMITTIEPGLYFSSTLENIPEDFKGIGVRIEDDILITADGPVVLSNKVPKEIDEIEQLMAMN